MQLPPTGSIPGLDTARLDELRDLDPGDTTYLDRAIANFTRRSAEVPAELRSHVEAGDAAALRADAHRMVGSALNLGAVVAVEPLRSLEAVGESGTTRGAEAMLPTVEGSLRRARELLAEYRSGYADQPDAARSSGPGAG